MCMCTCTWRPLQKPFRETHSWFSMSTSSRCTRLLELYNVHRDCTANIIHKQRWTLFWNGPFLMFHQMIFTHFNNSTLLPSDPLLRCTQTQLSHLNRLTRHVYVHLKASIFLQSPFVPRNPLFPANHFQNDENCCIGMITSSLYLVGDHFFQG